MIPDYADMELRKAAISMVQILLKTGAVRYDAANPFRVGDQMVSPLHVNMRSVLGWPEEREQVLRLALEAIDRDIGAERFDAVACCTEGQGLPFAALIADRLSKPLLFVRRQPGAAPHKQDVEGRAEQGWRVLLVEQLAMDGHRKEALIRRLEAAGMVVTDLFVLFQYGLFDSIHSHLSPLGVRLHALATWWDVLEATAESDHLPSAAQDEIRRYLKSPASWEAPQGGASGQKGV